MQIITWEDNPWDVTTCINAFEKFRSDKTLDLDFFHKMSGFMNTISLDQSEHKSMRSSDLLVHIKITDSISESNRLIKNGGVKFNTQPFKNMMQPLGTIQLFLNQWLLIQFGKSQAGIIICQTIADS
ncbi:MAG TPA: hypothetical protein VKR58_01660 [Aquella sp.]|nr:hypothetical protein [Aquella sp.]